LFRGHSSAPERRTAGAEAGVIRKRREGLQVQVFAGRDPLTGRKRWVSRQVPGQTKAAYREAKKVEAQLLEQVDRGEHREGRSRTGGELVERWLEWRQQVRPISPVTVANYRGAIDRYIIPTLGRAKVHEVDAATIDALYARVRAHGGKCRDCWKRVHRREPPLRAGERYRPRPGADARASLGWYRQLDQEWDRALGLRWRPSLLLLPDGPPATLAAWPGVELLGADRIAELTPGLAPVAAGLLAHDQAQVHPLRLAAVLARRAGSVATGTAMVDAEVAGGRIVRVRTTTGDLWPGVVVFATGLAPERWVRLPQRLVKGHLVATEPGRFGLPCGVHAPGLGIGPTGDGKPVIDRVPGIGNAWVSAGHDGTGLLLAAATGQAIATWIATGTRPEQVDSFGLSRFGQPGPS
jgi:hypothetical protein